jgi:hypothetical protein
MSNARGNASDNAKRDEILQKKIKKIQDAGFPYCSASLDLGKNPDFPPNGRGVMCGSTNSFFNWLGGKPVVGAGLYVAVDGPNAFIHKEVYGEETISAATTFKQIKSRK